MKRSSQRLAEAQVALMLLTRLPVARLTSPPSLAESRWAFPLVGAVVGALIAGIYMLLVAAGIPPLAAAIVALIAGLFITGALHEDGLADSADGLGGSNAAHRLEIMRDSQIGSYGALALILIMGLRVVALAEMGVSLAAFCGLVAAAMLSRLIMVFYLDMMAPARADGLGKSAANGEKHGRLLAGLGLSLPAILFLFLYMPLALVGLLVVGTLFGWAMHRKMGGQTGDICGAGQILGETAAWVLIVSLSVL